VRHTARGEAVGLVKAGDLWFDSHPVRVRRAHFVSSIAVVASVLLLALVGTALAATKFTGGTYSGTLAPATTVTLTLKLTRTKVSGILLSSIPPCYENSGGPSPTIKLKSAKIAKTGKFATTGTYVIDSGPYKGKAGYRFSLKGRFRAGGKVSGTLKTVSGVGSKCNSPEADEDFTATA
jgi:hypothetical protein